MVYCDSTQCDECGACVSVCPENALILTDALAVDGERCISCGKCVAVCPFKALSLTRGIAERGDHEN